MNLLRGRWDKEGGKGVVYLKEHRDRLPAGLNFPEGHPKHLWTANLVERRVERVN